MDIITEKNLPDFVLPPIQKWDNEIFKKAGIQVHILRLDSIHPLIGGNKWMKLKGFIQKALAGGKEGIITKGGPWSNHVHACAWLCNNLHLKCEVWIKGNTNITSAMLTDIVGWGAAIRYVYRMAFYDEELVTNFATENNLQYIPMGGADVLGVKYVAEYMQQLKLPIYDYAICAVGTATTLGGLALVPHNFSNIVGVDAGTNDKLVQQKIADLQQQIPHKCVAIINDYHFGGFAKYTHALISFMNGLYARHHIPSDIVYTGKLFYAVTDLAEKNYFPSGSKVLIIHSGGLQGNRSLPAGTLQF